MKYIDELIRRYPQLWVCENDIKTAVNIICEMHHKGGKLLLCGNGGSAADSEHISGEMMKSFLLERRVDPDGYSEEKDIIASLQYGIPALPLSAFTAFISAFANDENPLLAYAQLVFVLGKDNDVFLGISTSGSSENIVSAAKIAKVKGMHTIALTGNDGGKLKDICHTSIVIPESETYKIQELHLPVYHAICAQVEENIFG